MRESVTTNGLKNTTDASQVNGCPMGARPLWFLGLTLLVAATPALAGAPATNAPNHAERNSSENDGITFTDIGDS